METKYYVWLLLTLGAGSRTAVRLLRVAGTAAAVYEDPSDELMKEARVKASAIRKLRSERDLGEAEKIVSRCEENGITILTPDMPEYPRSLLCIMDFPVVLFCKGKLPDFNGKFCCGVVGTRKMTDYGKKVAYNVGWGLGDSGAVLVSGLALGIDGMAMAGAQSAGGATVGVLGCGIDVIYPQEHKDLFDRTLTGGAIITEYPPGSPPLRHHFPERNRIISGLCQAVAVVEADAGSGALITAKHALYQGRSVFAVPGNIGDKGAEGCNMLISKGAQILLSANDIISKYEFIYPHCLKPAGTPPGMNAEIAAGAARVGSAADPDSKRRGDGIYGGKKKGSPFKRTKKKEPDEETPVPSDIFLDPDAAKKLAGEKTKQLRHTHIDLLGDAERDIYYSMEPGTPMLPEEIGKGKYNISQVLTAMTLLEIAGAVEAGAGGYYVRCADDDGLLDGTTDDGSPEA